MSDQHDSDQHGHEEDHAGYSVYYAVAVALVILTGMSYLTYTPLWPEALDFPAVKRLWMMLVSCSKAALVIMVFMHLWWEANWKWVLTVPASCMSVFLALALVPDIGMRQNNGYAGYSRERMLHAAEVSVDEDAEHQHEDDSSSGHGDGH